MSLVFHCCLFGESPEGKLGPLTTGLTEEQARIFQGIAWEAVEKCRWARVR